MRAFGKVGLFWNKVADRRYFQVDVDGMSLSLVKRISDKDFEERNNRECPTVR